MRSSATGLLHGGADLSRALEWAMIGLIGVCSLALTLAAATINLDPAEQSVLAVATVVVFLIANRRGGRPTTLFLTMLSALVSLRYIVWRVTETLEFNTALQGFLGVGLALAEAYAIVALAMGYVQTLWPLGGNRRRCRAIPMHGRPSTSTSRPTTRTCRLCVQRSWLPWRSTGPATSCGSTSSMTVVVSHFVISQQAAVAATSSAPTMHTPRLATSTMR